MSHNVPCLSNPLLPLVEDWQKLRRLSLGSMVPSAGACLSSSRMKTSVGPRRSDSSFFRSVFFKGDKRHSPAVKPVPWTVTACHQQLSGPWLRQISTEIVTRWAASDVSDVSTPETRCKIRPRGDQSIALTSPVHWTVGSTNLLKTNTKTYAPGFWCQEDVRKMSGSVKVAQSASRIPYELIISDMSLALRSLRDGGLCRKALGNGLARLETCHKNSHENDQYDDQEKDQKP